MERLSEIPGSCAGGFEDDDTDPCCIRSRNREMRSWPEAGRKAPQNPPQMAPLAGRRAAPERVLSPQGVPHMGRGERCARGAQNALTAR
jgi:hypothetical protein